MRVNLEAMFPTAAAKPDVREHSTKSDNSSFFVFSLQQRDLMFITLKHQYESKHVSFSVLMPNVDA